MIAVAVSLMNESARGERHDGRAKPRAEPGERGQEGPSREI